MVILGDFRGGVRVFSAAFRLKLVVMRRYIHVEKNIKKSENVPPPFWL